ncbi:hypothetical protein SDC9_169637 [bioreactor metagenome]|uniref:Uncharacterized protein n=1 Tax=bioreactor metagenome TaxID=1076179 RepID=A0A645GE22_9ZZZZ
MNLVAHGIIKPSKAFITLHYITKQLQRSRCHIIIKRDGIYIPTSPATVFFLCIQQIKESFQGSLFVRRFTIQTISIGQILYLRKGVTIIECASFI